MNIRHFNAKWISKKATFNTILLAVAFIVTMVAIITGSYVHNGYNISVGAVSPARFVAHEAVKNEVATKRLIDEAVAEISPLYAHNTEVQEKVLNELDTFFSEIKESFYSLEKESISAESRENTLTVLNSENESAKYNVPEKTDQDLKKSASKIYLTQQQIKTLSLLSKEEFDDFESNIKKVTQSALEQGIREDTETKTLLFIKEEFNNLKFSDELSNIGYVIISSVIEPNLIVDVEATEKVKQDKINSIEPVMVLKNQKIVDDGEIITEESYTILNALGYIQSTDLLDSIIPILGVCIVVLIIFLSTVFYIATFHKKMYMNKKEPLLLFTLYTIVVILTRAFVELPYMFVPVLGFTMLSALLLNYKLSLVLNFTVSIICFLIYSGNSAFLLYFITMGMVTALTVGSVREHNTLLTIGIFNCIVSCFLMAGITFYVDQSFSENILQNVLFSMGSNFIMFIICTGSLPIWESLFGMVTSYKLLELINPNKKLLRRLMLEAPGTYHHSLIVANLAEAAAYDIGADASLAKVGGYYHDIGKLKYPQYFSENIIGKNIHDYMDPYNSVKLIKSHVEAGIELAVANKLPDTVKSIIEQHHGNTVIKFFYHKAKEKYPNDPISEKDFRYSASTPKSKEAAVVMLADTVEAAVRSKMATISNINEIEEFVNLLIKDKLNDGQLKDSSLKIKDLSTISKAFMGVFKGMYHERIPYPQEEDKQEKEEKNDEQQKYI